MYPSSRHADMPVQALLISLEDILRPGPSTRWTSMSIQIANKRSEQAFSSTAYVATNWE